MTHAEPATQLATKDTHQIAVFTVNSVTPWRPDAPPGTPVGATQQLILADMPDGTQFGQMAHGVAIDVPDVPLMIIPWSNIRALFVQKIPTAQAPPQAPPKVPPPGPLPAPKKKPKK